LPPETAGFLGEKERKVCFQSKAEFMRSAVDVKGRKRESNSKNSFGQKVREKVNHSKRDRERGGRVRGRRGETKLAAC